MGAARESWEAVPSQPAHRENAGERLGRHRTELSIELDGGVPVPSNPPTAATAIRSKIIKESRREISDQVPG